MEEKKKNQEEKKLTYDELVSACNNLYKQNIQLKEQNENLAFTLENVRRLNYLFSVLKYKDLFPTDFVDKCVQDIQEALTITKEEETPQEEK